MKKLLVGISLFLFATVLVSPVSAIYHNRGRGQEVREQVQTTIGEKRAPIQQRVEELRQHREELNEQRKLEIRERVATRRAEIASRVAQLKTLVIERIKAIFTTILDRMIAAFERLDKIVARINSRIAKLEGRGLDMTAPKAVLANCSDEKTATIGAINDAKAALSAIDPTSVAVRDAVQTANSAMRTGKRALQNYHKCLVNVIITLKALLPKEATGSGQEVTESAE